MTLDIGVYIAVLHRYRGRYGGKEAFDIPIFPTRCENAHLLESGIQGHGSKQTYQLVARAALVDRIHNDEEIPEPFQGQFQNVLQLGGARLAASIVKIFELGGRPLQLPTNLGNNPAQEGQRFILVVRVMAIIIDILLVGGAFAKKLYLLDGEGR